MKLKADGTGLVDINDESKIIENTEQGISKKQIKKISIKKVIKNES